MTAKSSKEGRELMDMDSRMFAKKSGIDNLNQEIAEFFYCERADFTQEIDYGDEFASHLTDFYPTLVRRELGDQLGAMVRPADRQWFKATAANKKIARDRASADFLEFMTDVNRMVLYSRDSGFRGAAKMADHDFAAFGMSWRSVCYSKDKSNLHFANHHPKLCAGDEGPDGKVNHVHRKCDMNAFSMKYWFGEDKLPETVNQALKANHYDEKFKTRHVFIPIDKYEPTRKFPEWAKWADVYVMEDGTILQELPSATFDYLVPRWSRVSDRFYAFSPATIIALPNARMIQRMMMTIIEAAEKQVDPPLLATQDALIGPIDISAGEVTYIDSEYDERLGAALRPLDLGKNSQLGIDMILDQRRLLGEAFYINKLSPLATAQREKTAYETSMIVAEYIRNALPLFEPLEDEDADATLDLVTEKIMRAGGYGPVDKQGIPVDMPDALFGQEITYEYNNSLKEARERQTVAAFNEGIAITAGVMQIDPALVGEIDMRVSFRDALAAIPGSRSDWLKDEKQAAQERQAAQAAMAQQAAMSQVQQGAEAAGAAGVAGQEVAAAADMVSKVAA